MFPPSRCWDADVTSSIYSQVENNFAQEHVFECCDGSGAVDGVVALEGLEEVGVGRLPVLLLGCVDDPCNRGDTAG